MSKENKDFSDEKTSARIRRFGEFLVEKRLISTEERDDALAIQNAINLRLGILANMQEIITIGQIFDVLEYQKESGEKFGEAAKHLHLIDKVQLGKLLQSQEKLRMKVGEILVGLTYLKKEEMETALERFIRETCGK